MSRTVTAIFRTMDVANTVKREIEQLGVSGSYISVVGGADRAGEIDHLHLPHDEAVTYQRAVQQGHYIVSAEVDEDHVNQVAEIMRHPEQGVDIDAYETDYRATPDYETDYAAYNERAAGYGYATDTAAGTTMNEGEETVQLAEERIAVGKRDVDRGTTHVRTYVQEVPVEERVRLRDEHVSVERRAATGAAVTGAAADALFQERDIAVTEHDEEAVVAKEAVVTEEVVVRKDVEERDEVVRDTVRKTEVDVDKTS